MPREPVRPGIRPPWAATAIRDTAARLRRTVQCSRLACAILSPPAPESRAAVRGSAVSGRGAARRNPDHQDVGLPGARRPGDCRARADRQIQREADSAVAAAFTFATRSAAMSNTLSIASAVGLHHVHRPGVQGLHASSPPRWRHSDDHGIGRGHLLAQEVQPADRGMFRSRVMTSGRSCSVSSSALPSPPHQRPQGTGCGRASRGRPADVGGVIDDEYADDLIHESPVLPTASRKRTPANLFEFKRSRHTQERLGHPDEQVSGRGMLGELHHPAHRLGRKVNEHVAAEHECGGEVSRLGRVQ